VTLGAAPVGDGLSQRRAGHWGRFAGRAGCISPEPRVYGRRNLRLLLLLVISGLLLILVASPSYVAVLPRHSVSHDHPSMIRPLRRRIASLRDTLKVLREAIPSGWGSGRRAPRAASLHWQVCSTPRAAI